MPIQKKLQQYDPLTDTEKQIRKLRGPFAKPITERAATPPIKRTAIFAPVSAEKFGQAIKRHREFVKKMTAPRRSSRRVSGTKFFR